MRNRKSLGTYSDLQTSLKGPSQLQFWLLMTTDDPLLMITDEPFDLSDLREERFGSVFSSVHTLGL